MSATTVNVPNVRESVNSSLKEISRQEDALKKISDEINFMDSAWDSDAQRAYTNKFRTMKTEMDKFNQSKKEYLWMMQAFVDDCVSTDSTVAGSFKGISI